MKNRSLLFMMQFYVDSSPFVNMNVVGTTKIILKMKACLNNETMSLDS